MLTIEDVDLLAVAMHLRDRFGNTLDQGYLDGRTLLRDAVADHLRCSSYEAEKLVDTMEAQGYLIFPQLDDMTHSRRAANWHILDHD
jgi:hypothetical protein